MQEVYKNKIISVSGLKLAFLSDVKCLFFGRDLYLLMIMWTLLYYEIKILVSSLYLNSFLLDEYYTSWLVLIHLPNYHISMFLLENVRLIKV